MSTKEIFFWQIECDYTNTAIDIPSLNLTSTNQDEENNSIICNLASASLIECTAQVGSVYAPSPASPPASTVTELISLYYTILYLTMIETIIYEILQTCVMLNVCSNCNIRC